MNDFFFLFKLSSFGAEPFLDMRKEEEEKELGEERTSRAATAIAEETQASSHSVLFIVASFWRQILALVE